MKADDQLLKNLVYFYLLVYPNKASTEIFANWYKNSALAEYTRPELPLLEQWIKEFRQTYGN